MCTLAFNLYFTGVEILDKLLSLIELLTHVSILKLFDEDLIVILFILLVNLVQIRQNGGHFCLLWLGFHWTIFHYAFKMLVLFILLYDVF